MPEAVKLDIPRKNLLSSDDDLVSSSSYISRKEESKWRPKSDDEVDNHFF